MAKLRAPEARTIVFFELLKSEYHFRRYSIKHVKNSRDFGERFLVTFAYYCGTSKLMGSILKSFNIRENLYVRVFEDGEPNGANSKAVGIVFDSRKCIIIS